MDFEDDFQFKPLTEGLGFHKKEAINNPDPIEKCRSALGMTSTSHANNTRELPSSSVIDDVVKSFKTPMPDFIEPKATLRPEPKATLRPEPKATLRPEPKATQNTETKATPKSDQNPKLKSSTRVHWEPAIMSPLAFMVDTLMVMALSLGLLIVALLVTKIDIVNAMLTSETDFLFYFTLPTMLLGMILIYSVTSRCFMGATIGEMVFDLQIGLPEKQFRNMYGLKVTLRTLITMATGICLLPIMSLFLQRDLAGDFTGAPLVKRWIQ